MLFFENENFDARARRNFGFGLLKSCLTFGYLPCSVRSKKNSTLHPSGEQWRRKLIQAPASLLTIKLTTAHASGWRAVETEADPGARHLRWILCRRGHAEVPPSPNTQPHGGPLVGNPVCKYFISIF